MDAFIAWPFGPDLITSEDRLWIYRVGGRTKISAPSTTLIVSSGRESRIGTPNAALETRTSASSHFTNHKWFTSGLTSTVYSIGNAVNSWRRNPIANHGACIIVQNTYQLISHRIDGQL